MRIWWEYEENMMRHDEILTGKMWSDSPSPPAGWRWPVSRSPRWSTGPRHSRTTAGFYDNYHNFYLHFHHHQNADEDLIQKDVDIVERLLQCICFPLIWVLSGHQLWVLEDNIFLIIFLFLSIFIIISIILFWHHHHIPSVFFGHQLWAQDKYSSSFHWYCNQIRLTSHILLLRIIITMSLTK